MIRWISLTPYRIRSTLSSRNIALCDLLPPAVVPLFIDIADFTWRASDLTFTKWYSSSIAALLVYHCIRLLSRDPAGTSPS